MDAQKEWPDTGVSGQDRLLLCPSELSKGESHPDYTKVG
jgi:hypothetical protein